MYITVDEAITYTDHIRPRLSGLLDFSAANNHFLNTLLAKVTSALTPYNELSLRIPSLAVGGWFFLFYLPRKVGNYLFLAFFAAIALFPYVISEYWSMSRGYFMSSCFAAAATIELFPRLNEKPIDLRQDHKSNPLDSKHSVGLCSARVFAALSTLSSFVMMPFAASVLLATYLPSRKRCQYYIPSKKNALTSTLLLALAISTSIYGIYSFQSSGEALAKVRVFSVFDPFTAVARAPLLGDPTHTLAYEVLFIVSFIVTLALRKWRFILSWLPLALSIAIIWIGGSVTGGFPVERSWIPYWFSICFLSTSPLLFCINAKISRFWMLAGRAVCVLALVMSISHVLSLYRNDYSYYWRTNYYQVRSLFYYSSIGKDYCLDPSMKGDRALIFYWDDPKSAIREPRTCESVEERALGFTNFDIPGDRFVYPEKRWGKYSDDEFGKAPINIGK